jgi:hypothetical protein
MNYRQKYLKYKTKYLKLKGGMDKPGESSDIFNNPDRMNRHKLEDYVLEDYEQEDYEQEDYEQEYNEQEDMNQSSCVSTDLNQFNVRNHWYSNDIKYFLPKYNLPKDYYSHKKYYLPCEITKITKNLFMNNNIVNLIKEKIYSDNDIFKNIITMNSNITFYQDPLIFLKNNDEQGNDMVFIDNENKINLKLDDNINRINIDMKSHIDKGGNFIASPKIGKNKSVVFYLNGNYNIGDPIKNAFNKYLDQELVELNCSFTMGGIRHIDEVMTFMPYDENHNQNKFKVWIYKIRNITFTDKYINMYKLDDAKKKINEDFILNLNSKISLINDINIKNLVIKIRNDINELNKSSYDMTIIDNTDIIKINIFDFDHMMLLKNYFCNNNGNYKNAKTKTKLINILEERLVNENDNNYITLINYLLNRLVNNICISQRVFNRFIFTLDDLTYLKKYILNKNINSKLAFKNVNEIKNILYNEQQLNLDIISQKLFNSKYYENDNFNNFVMFPIDLLITSNFQCITKTIPIFNRIWYETDKQCIALIPIGNEKDDDIIKKYNKEKKYIKSYLNPGIQIEYYLINTQSYNDDGLPKFPDPDNTFHSGGNLHCLIKNKY